MLITLNRCALIYGWIWLAIIFVIILVTPVTGMAQQKCTPGSGNIGAGNDDSIASVSHPPSNPSASVVIALSGDQGSTLSSPLIDSPEGDLTQGTGTLAPASGQFTYQIIVPGLSQAVGGTEFSFFLWHGTKSVCEYVALYPEGPRAFGYNFRSILDDCLVDPQPGEKIERVCEYGLAVVAEMAGSRIVECEQESRSKPGMKVNVPFTEYYYQPFGDGTRMVYE